MTKDEALKLALEALENIKNDPFKFDLKDDIDNAITAIKEALAQPEQEPVALEEKFSLLLWDYQELERAFEKITGGKWIRKSNTPQRTWVGLTEDEAFACQGRDYFEAYKAIEAKLKEKNT